jgi:YVTN family beta-propeller protein
MESPPRPRGHTMRTREEGVDHRQLVRATRAATLIAVTILAASCGEAPAPPPPAATPAPAPAGERIYVTDERGNNVVVVDPASGTVVSTIAVGKRPRGAHLSLDGKELFVALSGSAIGGPNVDESKLPPPDRTADGIGVVDLASGRVSRVMQSGPDPETFDISPDGKTIFLSNEDNAEMSSLDVASGKITASAKVGEEPEGVTVRPGGKEVYVTSEGDGAVYAIDATTLKVLSKIAAAPRPRSIAFTADGATAFVTSENSQSVAVIDANTHKRTKLIEIPSPSKELVPRPMGIVLSHDGARAYVSLGRGKGVAVLDVTKQEFVRHINDVGDRPWGLAVSLDGTKLYTANGGSGDISIVDIATGNVEKRIKVGVSPWGVTVGK